MDTSGTRTQPTVPASDRQTTGSGASRDLDRRTALRALGATGGTVLVAAGGGLAWRAFDQGVLEVGEGPAYRPWETWQDGDGLLPLVRAAILAPSPHNAQAWTFAVGTDRIDLDVDPDRGTGPVDPFRREMHVGLGAALENLVLAAWAQGVRPTVTLAPAGSAQSTASVALEPTSPRRGDLYRAIPRRRTNRFAYADRDVPASAMSEMSGLVSRSGPGAPSDDLGDDVTLLWFDAPAARGRVGELLVAATEAFAADADQIGTDYRWFRQSWDDVQRFRDGITVDAAGLPPLTAAMAKLLPAQSAEATARSWVESVRTRHTATARAYGLIAVRDADDLVQRVTGGRLLERVHLWATVRGLAVHHMNQITERSDRERQLGRTPEFGDALAALVPDGWQGLVMFRIGYPTRTPNRSPRRSVADVLTIPAKP